MKQPVSFLLVALFALPAFSQTKSVALFTGKTFTKTSSRSDTSTTITFGAYPEISIQTTTVGTDSANISVHVDAMINGLWSNDILVASAVALGRAAGHTLEGSAHTGQVSDFLLRDNGRIADLLMNTSQLRVRNVLTAGAGDSTGSVPLNYTQSLALRKVTW